MVMWQCPINLVCFIGEHVDWSLLIHYVVGKLSKVNCLQCESFAILICGAFVDTMESVVRGGLIGGKWNDDTWYTWGLSLLLLKYLLEIICINLIQFLCVLVVRKQNKNVCTKTLVGYSVMFNITEVMY